MNELQKTSKTLSYWLRHSPEAANLKMDGEGWVATQAVLEALKAEGLPDAFEHLSTVVMGSDKKRFEVSADLECIRARQGHSVTVEADWKAAVPPPTLFHGTVDRFLESILVQGLLPQARHHVHLSSDIETARNVGIRRGKPVILEVNAGKLVEDGAAFFLSGNGVWLTDHVPPSALRRID